MLSPSGKVRHLILSEQGFTSDSPVHGGQCPISRPSSLRKLMRPQRQIRMWKPSY